MRIPRSIIGLALFLPTAGALVYFAAADPNDPFFRFAYAGSKVIQFALPMVALLAWDRGRLRAVRPCFNGLAGGLAFGLVTLAATVGLYWLGLRQSPMMAGVGEAVREKVAGFGLDSPARYIAFAVFLSFGHAFLEEYYWRWFVHHELRQRMNPTIARLISSTGFAAHHVVVLAVYFPGRFWTAALPFAAAIAFGGAVWAYLYDRKNSLAGPWTAHILADIGILAVGYDLLYL